MLAQINERRVNKEKLLKERTEQEKIAIETRKNLELNKIKTETKKLTDANKEIKDAGSRLKEEYMTNNIDRGFAGGIARTLEGYGDKLIAGSKGSTQQPSGLSRAIGEKLETIGRTVGHKNRAVAAELRSGGKKSINDRIKDIMKETGDIEQTAPSATTGSATPPGGAPASPAPGP